MLGMLQQPLIQLPFSYYLQRRLVEQISDQTLSNGVAHNLIGKEVLVPGHIQPAVSGITFKLTPPSCYSTRLWCLLNHILSQKFVSESSENMFKNVSKS